MNISITYFNNITIRRSARYSPEYESRIEIKEMKSIYNESGDKLTEDITYQIKQRNRTATAQEARVYSYVFDTNGNWIKRKTISDIDDPDKYGWFGKSSTTIEDRRIDYHN